MKRKIFSFIIIPLISISILIQPICSFADTYEYSNDANSEYEYKGNVNQHSQTNSQDISSEESTESASDSSDTSNTSVNSNDNNNYQSTDSSKQTDDTSQTENSSNVHSTTDIPNQSDAFYYFYTIYSGDKCKYDTSTMEAQYNGITFAYNDKYGIYTANGENPDKGDYDYDEYINAYRNGSMPNYLLKRFKHVFEKDELKKEENEENDSSNNSNSTKDNSTNKNANSSSENSSSSTGWLKISAKVFKDFDEDGYIIVQRTDVDVEDESNLPQYKIYLYKINGYVAQQPLPVGEYTIIDGGKVSDLTSGKTTTDFDPDNLDFTVHANTATILSTQFGNVDGTRVNEKHTMAQPSVSSNTTVVKKTFPWNKVIVGIICAIAFIGLAYGVYKIMNKIHDEG